MKRTATRRVTRRFDLQRMIALMVIAGLVITISLIGALVVSMIQSEVVATELEIPLTTETVVRQETEITTVETLPLTDDIEIVTETSATVTSETTWQEISTNKTETTTIMQQELISVTLDEIDSQPWERRIGSKYKVSKSDFVHLCNLVGREYGADFVPIEEKALVAQTVMNRVMSEHFPNTVQEVIEQPGQYSGWLSRGHYSEKVTESVREAVLYCLNGNVPNDQFVFYWGDGHENHFYTYEMYAQFAYDLNQFKASKSG